MKPPPLTGPDLMTSPTPFGGTNENDGCQRPAAGVPSVVVPGCTRFSAYCIPTPETTPLTTPPAICTAASTVNATETAAPEAPSPPGSAAATPTRRCRPCTTSPTMLVEPTVSA